MFSQLTKRLTRILLSGIFKQLMAFVVVPDVLSKFSKIGNVSSSEKVYDVSNSWNYILLCVTYNFGLGKRVKIERNDGKLLCVKTSRVDWSLYTWAQWVSKTIRQNRMGFSHIFSWSCPVWLLTPSFFPQRFNLLCLA